MTQHIYDISVPISESLVVWPDDIPVEITQPSHLSRGDVATVSRLRLGAHAGTHVDAPAHFIPGGSNVDSLDLDVLVGPAFVVEAVNADALSASVLEALSLPQGIERVLFQTRNSERWERGEKTFSKEFVGLTEDGARWLVSRGIKLVGTDYLSVAAFGELVSTHRVLLEAGVILVESLNLSGIAAGMYQLVCLPLKLEGVEGAPARVILIDQVEEHSR
jgi:arylformamidase